MRKFWVVAAALLLCGCESADWDGSLFPSATGGAATAAPAEAGLRSASASSAANTKCERAARERSGDAAVQDFDLEMQRKVYDATYADCLKWSAATLLP
ncbi:MAG: hypothetical protein WDN03_18615 [Rhizomicrobium sp.]